MMTGESDEGQRDKLQDKAQQMSSEVPPYHSPHPAGSAPNWFPSSGPSSSASISSLSSTSGPDSPQKISEACGCASSGESVNQNSEGTCATSTSKDQHNAAKSGMNDDLESMKVQSTSSKNSVETANLSPVRSCQRPLMPGL